MNFTISADGFVGEVADLAAGLSEPSYSVVRRFSAVGEVIDLADGLTDPGYRHYLRSRR